MKASEVGVAKRAEGVSGVSGASVQTSRATEWPVKNTIVCD